MSKLFFYDLETTGVKHWRNGIHQISGLIVINGVEVEEFNFKVKPFEKAIIEDDALQIAGVTKEDVLNYEPMELVYEKIISILSKYISKFNKLDKFHLVGYNNASFDNQFLRAFFVQNNDQYFGSWFWADTIDCMVLASNKLKDDRNKLPNFQLKTVSKHLGIEVDENKLHDALYDIELTKRIYDLVA